MISCAVVVALAVDLAQALTKKQIELDPSIIATVVREAIDQLHEVQQPAQLYVHPTDAETLRNTMQGELELGHWKIIVDSQMERGGCRLETGYNLVDATLTSRWNRLSQAILSTSTQSQIQSHIQPQLQPSTAPDNL